MRCARSPRILACALPLLAGCALLGDLGTGYAPEVEFGGQAVLVQYPSVSALAVYSCDRLLNSYACLAFGPPPTKEELQFRFQIPLTISNPNRVPVPTTELLVGLQVYPAETWGELGAVCTTLCNTGATDCPATPAEACVDRAGDLDTTVEFFAAAVGGVLTLAAEAANGEPVGHELSRFTVPASGTLDLKVTFAIGIDPMLTILEKAGKEVLIAYLTSGDATLDIPYAVAGRLWFSVPYLGRVGVDFGPVGAPPDAPLNWHVL